MPDVVLAAPVAFCVGLTIGVWIGGRFLVIRKRKDE